MFEKVDELPIKVGRLKSGKRIRQIQDFLDSGMQIGVYQMQDGETLYGTYHSFKNAIKTRSINDVDITIRQKRLYFIRKD